MLCAFLILFLHHMLLQHELDRRIKNVINVIHDRGPDGSESGKSWLGKSAQRG